VVLLLSRRLTRLIYLGPVFAGLRSSDIISDLRVVGTEIHGQNSHTIVPAIRQRSNHDDGISIQKSNTLMDKEYSIRYPK
jgi:hypothetical protein